MLSGKAVRARFDLTGKCNTGSSTDPTLVITRASSIANAIYLSESTQDNFRKIRSTPIDTAHWRWKLMHDELKREGDRR